MDKMSISRDFDSRFHYKTDMELERKKERKKEKKKDRKTERQSFEVKKESRNTEYN